MNSVGTSNCDVTIVGAGPAGLMAALTAAKGGLDVKLLEKQYEIGYPVRTSGCSYTEDMKDLGIPEKFYNKIRRVVFATPNRTVELSYKEYGFCILDIRRCWQYLAMEAAKHGCELNVGTDVRGPIIENGFVTGVEAKRSNEDLTIKSKVVIDASGVSAVVARGIGAFTGTAKTTLSSGIEYEAYVENLDKETLVLMVGEKTAPAGYAWVFPTADHKARIGVGLTGQRSEKVYPYTLLYDLLKRRPNGMQDLGRITPIEIHAGTLPTEPMPKFYASNGLMVIGDAAFQATQIVGEGIRMSMKAGRLAAQVAKESIERDDFSEGAFKKYKDYAIETEKHNKIGIRVQKEMAAFCDKDWDHAADTVLQTIAKMQMNDVIAMLKSDFDKRKVLGILARNPGLLKYTTFRMIKRFA